MKKNFLVLVTLVFILSSCSSESNNDSKKLDNKAENHKPVHSADVREKYTDKDIEKIFLPPNFIVRKFDIVHKKNKIEFTMDYIFNEKLYNILNHGASYSFMIIYPEPVQQILHKKNSVIIPGKINSDGRLNYTISYAEELESDISEDKFSSVIRNDMEYQLHILNSRNEVFQIFPTFRYMVDYEEGKSEELFYE